MKKKSYRHIKISRETKGGPLGETRFIQSKYYSFKQCRIINETLLRVSHPRLINRSKFIHKVKGPL